jgi:hypothetical protein
MLRRYHNIRLAAFFPIKLDIPGLLVDLHRLTNIIVMYTQTWSKFLPVIRIVLKRAVAAPQMLELNRIDFDKAGGGKKVGFRFTVELTNAKLQNKVVSPVAQDLLSVLQQDEATAAILANRSYALDLNPKCELSIRCTSVAETTADQVEEAVLADASLN